MILVPYDEIFFFIQLSAKPLLAKFYSVFKKVVRELLKRLFLDLDEF